MQFATFLHFYWLKFSLTSKLLYHFEIQNIIIIIFKSKIYQLFSITISNLFFEIYYFSKFIYTSRHKKINQMNFFLTAIQFNIFEKRENSFHDIHISWSHERFSTQKIINADLHFFQIRFTHNDIVHCYTYLTILSNWKKNDDSYEMHLKTSSRYHWLKTHREKLMLIKKFTCKRCFVKFSNNIKLHEHIRTKHAKKSKQFFNHEKFFSTFSTSNASITTSHISIAMFSTFVALFSTFVALLISFFSFVSFSITSIKLITLIATSKKKYFNRK